MLLRYIHLDYENLTPLPSFFKKPKEFEQIKYFKKVSIIAKLLVPRTEHHLSSFKCGFLNIFFGPNLAALFVTPIVSATVEQIWREKSLKNHIPFNFWDDSTLSNEGAGKQ